MILFYLASSLLSGWSDTYRTITIGVIFHAVRVISRNRDEKIAKAVKLDEIRSAYNNHNAYIEDKISLFQTTALGKTEAYQLCSSTVVQQCLMSKQRGEALYSSALEPTSPDRLNMIARNLRMQKAGILGTVAGYEIMASTLNVSDGGLEELEAAKKWVLYMNARPLPAVPDSN
ncbi:hypothetical protein ARMGADRAFT_1170300 [Armillaria gallica]|uniref:Uncharacterized protein n=1 Tax=Armillaria gallica TaxID=47427 RepID=A0A2H3CZI4_ARMGA|nr:hypothetical protein ARMGADRAFT_1170300 [Armillaria gallica]